jgi:hypothetical protein
VGELPDAGRGKGGKVAFILAFFKIAAKCAMSKGKGSQGVAKVVKLRPLDEEKVGQ